MTDVTRPNLPILLDQADHWWPKTGDAIRLDDMGPRHRRNTLALLERGAASMKLQYECGPLPREGSAATDCFNDGMNQLIAQDAQAWLNEQPLVRRLRELVAADQAAGVPDEPDTRLGQPLPCAHWCRVCADEGPVTEPGAPLPCESCPDCDPRVAAADDATWD